jgi:hypothetical protein
MDALAQEAGGARDSSGSRTSAEATDERAAPSGPPQPGSSIEDTLRSVVETALTLLPEADHGGIILTWASASDPVMISSDTVASRLDHHHASSGSIDCGSPRPRASSPCDVLAQALGVSSHVVVPLSLRGAGEGWLSLYSGSSPQMDPRTRRRSEVLAAQASWVIWQTRELADLRAALRSRQTIGLACGLVMARFGIGPEEAFAYLSRRSQDSNRKLRTVAGDIVREAAQVRENSAGGPAPSPNQTREPEARDVVGHLGPVTGGPSAGPWTS